MPVSSRSNRRIHRLATPILWALGLTLSVSPAVLAACSPPSPDLIAWWRAEGSAAEARGVHPGSLAGSIGFAAGKVGQAFSFGGAGFIHVPDNPQFHCDSALTLHAWILPSSVSAVQQIISRFGPLGQYAYQLGLYPGGYLRSDISADGSDYAVLFSPAGAIAEGQWHHVAMTLDGHDWRLFVNGSEVASDSATLFPLNSSSTVPLTIGATDGIQMFQGLIDEPAVHSRALTPSEIGDLFSAGSDGMCLGQLVGVLPVLSAQEPGLELLLAGGNPSRGASPMSLRLPAGGCVSADVFDVTGARVRALVSRVWLPAGEHRIEWDGRDAAGRIASPGTYFARATIAGSSAQLKLLRRK